MESAWGQLLQGRDPALTCCDAAGSALQYHAASLSQMASTTRCYDWLLHLALASNSVTSHAPGARYMNRSCKNLPLGVMMAA